MHRIFSSKHIESWIQSHDLIICWLNGTGGRFSKCFCIFIGDLHIECIITFSFVKTALNYNFVKGVCSFSERHIIKTVIKNDLFQLAQIVTHPAIDLSKTFYLILCQEKSLTKNFLLWNLTQACLDISFCSFVLISCLAELLERNSRNLGKHWELSWGFLSMKAENISWSRKKM